MTIASEIQRLQAAKSCIKAAIESKGVNIPNDLKLQGYSDCINCIQQWWQLSDVQFMYTPYFWASWNNWHSWDFWFSTCLIWDYLFVNISANDYSKSYDYMAPKILYIKNWNKDWTVLSTWSVIWTNNSNQTLYWNWSWIKVEWNLVKFYNAAYYNYAGSCYYYWVACYNMDTCQYTWLSNQWSAQSWYWSDGLYWYSVTCIWNCWYQYRIYKN